MSKMRRNKASELYKCDSERLKRGFLWSLIYSIVWKGDKETQNELMETTDIRFHKIYGIVPVLQKIQTSIYEMNENS